ncbi:MAG: hypothetical protein ACOC55_05395 [Candidatus Natronoplasma sp.]
MRKFPFSLILVGVVVVVVGALAIGFITGWIEFQNIRYHFVTLVFLLVFISILAIIGAIFIGMFISHRIFSASGFTTFEEEMLQMRKDVQDIKKKLKEKEEGEKG